MKKSIKLLLAVVVLSSFIFIKEKPTIYLIGDSTVRNTNNVQRGWGTFLIDMLDSSKISVVNKAMAGRSTRTFLKEGRWDTVINAIKKGDFLMMQFGHNEGSKPDTSKAGYRGVLKGVGEDSVVLTWADGKPETVHSYGWYLKKFVTEAKAKGATVYICSMIPRNEFRDGKVIRADNDYGKWAKEVAEQSGAYFIDLNKITADKYDAIGAEEVKKYFPGDHTHTNEEGAKINAASVAEGIKNLSKNPLQKYLLNK